MFRPIVRLAAGAAVAVTAVLGGAAPALASHLQGGSIYAEVTATGHLQGTLTYADVYGCTLGQQSNQQITITAPTSQTANASVPMTATRCITGSATYKGTFDVPLDTSTFAGGAPDGAYSAYWTQGARIGGIINLTGFGTVKYETQVRKVSMQATGAPQFGSNVANGIGIGSAYAQNLNASDPDGGAVSYATKTKPADPNGPDSDIVTLSAGGKVTIPASTTAGFTGGQYYVYKVRATDAQGDYSERDVLLKVATSNRAPAITGLDASYTVKPGTRVSIPFTATDPDSADTVSVSAGTLPSWVTVHTTPGNPASGTLELNPPADVTGTFGINLDAEDDSHDVVLTASGFTQIVVAEAATPPPPPGVKPTITRAPASAAKSATFEFTGASAYECRIDGGAWTACASPYTPTGLADGTHTFEVRSDGSEPASATFTLDTTAPAAPAVIGGPSGATSLTSGSFDFGGEPGASFECRFDGGGWAPCTSPAKVSRLKRGKHVFEVRQTDAAGNVSAASVERFTVVKPTLDGVKSGAKNSKLTPVLASTVSTTSHSAKLGCRIPGVTITTCTIKAYVRVGGKKVLIGTGRASGRGTGERLSVKLKLNARGRALVNRAGGVKATFKLDARAGDTRLKTSTVARMLPSKTLAVPANGLFDVGSGRLTAKGKRYVRSLKGQLDHVKAIVCVGHTDSVGSDAANETLGRSRAESTCGALRALGVKARMRTASAGESRPRATNATEAGRALNRRVEIELSYR
jgi:outer membrane protein OmpA-like peptidoglycan-associated protein